MFAGLASPSHLIIALVIILLLFGAQWIPGLAKGVGAGSKELRQGLSALSTGEGDMSETPDSEKFRIQARSGPGEVAIIVRTVQRGL